ncbi:N-myristoyl transferase [Microthyrium microscopicum]|uniref:Glycylpeptide N-tetradecanoyltransferase n=1 Tax=Microthyrium microscopicum TaxID=703497 RepID=A0A6A6TYS7_9PEZI|nr:N-myristoyl transferase [Microthyrium microscopicum]
MAEENQPKKEEAEDTKPSPSGEASENADKTVANTAKDTADPKEVAAMLKKLGITPDKNPGIIGKGQKDMKDYAFWKSQPVPSFDEVKEQVAKAKEGPIKEIDKDQVPKEPVPMPDDRFAWVTMDLTKENETKEVYDLLSNHYVEDDEAMFRFNYSENFLHWALKAPGWQMEWHVGVRVKKPDGTLGSLVAFVSGIPIDLRVRGKTFRSAEVNYLCVHKKIRGKRLAPLLIKEITRRFYVTGIYQAIYTAGVVVPSPLSTCQYFHRTLDFDKLYDVGFAHLPPNVSRTRQALRFKLPANTSTEGLRPMVAGDVNAVRTLLKRYLQRFSIAQDFSKDDLEHWLVHSSGASSESERVVWTYVVETAGKITDFFSFYRLESTVIKSATPKVIKAAYLYYYATDAAFKKDDKKGEKKEDKKDEGVALKERLNELMKDMLILAKKQKFDVVNALTLLDNPLFLEQQKWGPGDGKLHYYLFNYRASPIAGGLDARKQVEHNSQGGMGMVML